MGILLVGRARLRIVADLCFGEVVISPRAGTERTAAGGVSASQAQRRGAGASAATASAPVSG